MKPIEEALKLDPEAILKEIRDRREVMKDLVGQLYPSILASEIERLDQEYTRKRYANK